MSIDSPYPWYLFLCIAFIHSEGNNQEILLWIVVTFLCPVQHFFRRGVGYVLGHHRRSKYNYQKMFFFIWRIYFNRKFTSDWPVRHLWNYFQVQEVPSKLKIHCGNIMLKYKKGMYFSFDFGLYSLYLDIFC